VKVNAQESEAPAPTVADAGGSVSMSSENAEQLARKVLKESEESA